MKEKELTEVQKEFVDILGRIKHFLENGKYETAQRYTSNEYYILKNDLFEDHESDE